MTSRKQLFLEYASFVNRSLSLFIDLLICLQFLNHPSLISCMGRILPSLQSIRSAVVLICPFKSFSAQIFFLIAMILINWRFLMYDTDSSL